MSFINVGAQIDGRDAPSKRALKITLQDHPERVTFYSTSELGQSFNGDGTSIPPGVTLSVCGPNPYNARKFYASVTTTAKGVRLT